MVNVAGERVVLPLCLQPVRFEDPELAQLANLLPGILVQDRAEKAVHTYINAFRRWKKWAIQHGVTVLPADPVPFALCLVYLIQQVRSVAAINSIVYGVHKKGGFVELSEHPLVKQVLEAARRILAKPAKRKTPLSIDVVRKLVMRLQDGNLAELQLVTLIALGFFGFLRWDDLNHLTFDKIHFEGSYVALFLEKRKNDQFREGSWGLYFQFGGSTLSGGGCQEVCGARTTQSRVKVVSASPTHKEWFQA